MVKYRLTPAAKKDLIAIWHYTVKVWGREKARQYLFDLEEKLKSLATKPELGRIRAEINPKYFSFPASNHTIYYLKSENHIHIIAILHKRRDVEKRLQGEINWCRG